MPQNETQVFMIYVDKIYMKNRNIIIITLVAISLLTSCSPFGSSSIIEQIGGSLIGVIQSKTSTELVSGGTQTLETNPTVPTQNYKVTISVGNQFNQPSTYTNDGYSVQATVQSNE